MAQPGDRGVGCDQRDGAAVGQHRVPLDRHRALAVEPVAPGLRARARAPARRPPGRPPGNARRGLAGPDLDADVRAVQLGERVLVGHVVAEEQHRARGELHAQRVDARCPCASRSRTARRPACRAVTWMSGQVAGPDRTASSDGVGHVRRRRCARAPRRWRACAPAVLPAGSAASATSAVSSRVAQRDRLGRRAARRSRRRTRCRGEPTRCTSLGSRDSAAEVAQRAAGDHRHGGLRQRGQRRASRRPPRAAGPPATGPPRSARACRRSRRRRAAAARGRCATRSRRARCGSSSRRVTVPIRDRRVSPCRRLPSASRNDCGPVRDVVGRAGAGASRASAGRLRPRRRCTARSSVSFMPSRSYGLTRNACRRSPAAPANSESTSAPPRSTRAATYSLATRFMPSRSGVTIMTSAAQNSATSSLRLYDWCR